MEKYKNINDIERDISLTPSQKNIEKIIFTKKVAPDLAEAIRIINSLKNEFQSTLHYHNSEYIQALINKSESFIESLT